MAIPLELCSEAIDSSTLRGEPMKTLSCDRCEHLAKGESFEDWMQDLMPHYMEAHADFMKDPSNGEAERAAWMTENRARFDQA